MKAIIFANTDWYIYNFRLPLARALRQAGYEVLLVSPQGEYGQRMEAEGFRWLVFPLSRRGMNPLHEVLTILRLRSLYRREQPQKICHFTVKCVLYGSLAAKLANIRGDVINSITGLGYLFQGDGLWHKALLSMVKVMYHIALKGTRVIFQNLEDMKLFQRSNLVRSEQTTLIPGSGVDTEKFTPLPEPEGTPVVAFIGRMLWDKGVGELVEAARALKEDGVAVRMALVGDSDMANPTSVPVEQLTAWKEEGLVEWWGWRDDVLEVLSQVHIVCLPSYGEGMPKSLAEAGACGRPVVASDVPGCREIVRHGENGLLVPVRDSARLAAALRSLIENPEMRRRMGARGREIVVDRYSLDRVIRETMQVIGQSGKEGSGR